MAIATTLSSQPPRTFDIAGSFCHMTFGFPAPHESSSSDTMKLFLWEYYFVPCVCVFLVRELSCAQMKVRECEIKMRNVQKPGVKGHSGKLTQHSLAL